jgi:hypothetical protein
MDWNWMCPVSIFEKVEFFILYGGLIVTLSDTIL